MALQKKGNGVAVPFFLQCDRWAQVLKGERPEPARYREGHSRTPRAYIGRRNAEKSAGKSSAWRTGISSGHEWGQGVYTSRSPV